MDTRTLRPYFVLIGLFAATALALAYTVDVDAPSEAGVVPHLPDQVGDWVGMELRFCQNKDHGRAWDLEDLQGSTTCLECGGAIGTMTWVEKGILPEDTVLVKKRYQDPNGRTVHASIVLSGRDRSSIHRPETCQTGGGGRLEGFQTIAVDLPGRDPLDVRVLDITRPYTGPQGQRIDYPTYYAYWFVGRNRETASHYTRIAYMAFDRVFLNVAHRWAYLSVGSTREPGSDAHLQEIEDFIRAFYPQIQLAGSSGSAE
jgi:hypothetical protein